MGHPEEGGGASETTDPAYGTSAATDVSLKEYIDLQHRWLWRFLEERDRRLTELQAERDKAEVLRASMQAYRDEKANELREQINEERGRYVTHSEMKPIFEYVATQQGSRQGIADQRQLIAWLIAAALGIWAIAQALAPEIPPPPVPGP